MHLLCLIYLEYVCVRSINCCSAECRALPDEIVFSTLAAAAIASCEDGKDSDGGGSFNDALTAVFECIKKTSTATYDGAGQSMGQPIVHKGQKRVYVRCMHHSLVSFGSSSLQNETVHHFTYSTNECSCSCIRML